MKEQVEEFIKELKSDLKKLQKEAQEMLDNADCNHSIEDVEDYGILEGEIKTLKKIIRKLKSL